MDVFITARTLIHILSQINLAHALPISFSVRSILILYTRLRLVLPWGLLFSGRPHQNPVYPIVPHAPNIILLGLITPVTLGNKYSPLSSSLCSLHSPVTFSLLRPNVFLSTLFSNTLNPRSSHHLSRHVCCRTHKGVISVGVATRHGLDRPWIESPCGARLSAPVQTVAGAYSPSGTMETG